MIAWISYNLGLIREYYNFYMSSHPFEDHKKFYESIQLEERNAFLKEILKAPQI